MPEEKLTVLHNDFQYSKELQRKVQNDEFLKLHAKRRKKMQEKSARLKAEREAADPEGQADEPEDQGE